MVEIPQILSYIPNPKSGMVEDPQNLPIIPTHVKLTSQKHNESSKTSDYASLLFSISAWSLRYQGRACCQGCFAPLAARPWQLSSLHDLQSLKPEMKFCASHTTNHQKSRPRFWNMSWGAKQCRVKFREYCELNRIKARFGRDWHVTPRMATQVRTWNGLKLRTMPIPTKRAL